MCSQSPFFTFLWSGLKWARCADTVWESYTGYSMYWLLDLLGRKSCTRPLGRHNSKTPSRTDTLSRPGKKERQRKDLTGAEKDDLRSLERKLEKRLNTGYRSMT